MCACVRVCALHVDAKLVLCCSVPLKSVEYKVNGKWWSASRSVNNQWPYHREIGDFSFPLPIRVTSVAGEVLEDVVPSSSGLDMPPIASHKQALLCKL